MNYYNNVEIKQIDFQLANWIESQEIGSIIGTVHSIFNKVINFVSVDESMFFTIAINTIIQSPKMMKVKNESQFLQLSVSLKPSVSICLVGKNRLKIGVYTIDYGNATKWEGELLSPPLIKDKLSDENLEMLNYYIQDNGVDGGMLSAWKKFFDFDINKAVFYKNIYSQRFYDNLQLLNIETKTSEIIKALDNFVGIGVGLTPSGDDFLTGVIATWNYYNFRLYSAVVKEQKKLLPKIKMRTTIVSYFMLENCLNGFVNDALMQLIKNLDKQSEYQIRQVLNIGSTSGTDMLIGVSYAYYHLLNN